MTEILKRKTDHIDLVLKQRLEVAAQASPWDEVQLTHNTLPEQDLLRFDLSTEFLGKRLRLPFLISSMTGGPFKAEKINAHLACLLYTSPSPRDAHESRMPSSA